jgi:glycosyltransferase involved in cell wall biosynthesis
MIPAVSILAPIYNSSAYIERCAHSLFRQTFEAIEYIFVNDCTPDDSIKKLQKVIEQYPNRKPFVKIITNEKNRGTSASRQTGIDNSTGKYIQFVDNDDYIEPDMIETMYKKAIEENADIVVCDFVMEKRNGKKEHHSDYVPENPDDYFYYILEQDKCFGYIWTKLVCRELYELPDCRFVTELNLLDDRYAVTRLYYYAKKIVKVDKAFYHYDRANINAQTAIKTSWHYDNVILFHELLEKFLQGKELYEKYFDLVESSKVMLKIDLLIKTRSIELRKQYAYLYHDVEMKYWNELRRGEKIILFCTHYRLHFLAQIAQDLLFWKNRKNF